MATKITEALYRRRPGSWWKGRRVVSNREISTGVASMPAGTEFTIVDKLRGFGLRSDPCPHCGIRFFVKYANPAGIELIDGDQS